ncbi:DUF4007 family protein [Anaerobium acetethylicum]|uniref:DUF4007 domain-containing protein n=1 Tax=Anaerobium acetethylicum TaxID=1619234 RepID=A0A1D3TUL0_9FIRM|nr:DUF4007 family protein [Anaerobium acetethylicum]SCP97763.1 Protein of unknown function [Anaerobium acetethylicum]
MVVNKHGSFYMRSGWGTKIIRAVEADDMIFTPSKEQDAIDNVGLGRIMIKALRYWSEAMQLTEEEKTQGGIKLIPEPIYDEIKQYDLYFQRQGSLLLMHRNLALNKENATAWYWMFNEYSANSFTKTQFVEGFHAYLAVNGMKIKKDAVEKEFNCLKNTYIGDSNFDKKSIMDEDTYPFLAPLKILQTKGKTIIEKRLLTEKEIPLEILIYAIAMDNFIASKNGNQVNIDRLMEGKNQVGKYFNLKYSRLLDMLMEAENKKYINLNNNFGNRFIEFNGYDYKSLIKKYYTDKER